MDHLRLHRQRHAAARRRRLHAARREREHLVVELAHRLLGLRVALQQYPVRVGERERALARARRRGHHARHVGAEWLEEDADRLRVLRALGALAVVILEAAGLLHVVRAARESVASLVGAALGVVAVLATAVPSARLVAASNRESNTSRGEAIFDEAKTVKDHLGFMSKVKHELDELFEFLDDFEKETKQPLVIVLFVDDLDRCLGGRNVRVLEAIQLMLSIPGVPMLVFLGEWAPRALLSLSRHRPL